MDRERLWQMAALVFAVLVLIALALYLMQPGPPLVFPRAGGTWSPSSR